MRDSLVEVREFQLADWRVSPSEGVLRRGHVTRRVPPRLMRLLLVLASRPQQVISKQEIFDRVWDNIDASDESLCACVYRLRKTLGDESARPRYIETITKRGYRMLVDAQFQCAAPGTPDASPSQAGNRVVAVRAELSNERAAGFSAEAIAAFSRGRALLVESRLTRHLLQAKVYFEHALALEARFAAAHACLASIHVTLLYTQQAGACWAERARWNARAALDIDPLLGEAHAALAYVLGFVDGNFAAADAEYRKALELRPDLVSARRGYALLLAAMQRSDEALHEVAEAERRDPLNVSARHDIANIFFMLRRFDRAAEELRKILAREPKSWMAYAELAFIHWIGGNASEVHATYRAAAVACDTQHLLALIDRAFATGGVAGLYAAIARHLESRDPEHRYRLPSLAAIYIAAGDHARALRLLEDGSAQQSPHVLWLLHSPVVDSLRSEPGFQSLAARYGIAVEPSVARPVDSAGPQA